MKRYLLMLCACAALVCSCSKIGDNISDLNKRLDDIEANEAELLDKIAALKLLVQAKAAELTIESIDVTDEGLQIAFSDGKKYVISDGENTIDVTEDETSYTFDFGDDDVISVAKEFALVLEDDTIEVPAGSTVAVKYTIKSDDGTVHVSAKPLDKSKVVGVDEEAAEVSVLAVGRTGEEQCVLIRAIRNSDGKIAEKIVTLNCGPRAPVALEGAMAGYYGDSEVDGVDNYFTQFWKGEVDEDNYFVGEAYSLLFDFYVPISEVMALPAGTYVEDENFEPFTYVVGTEVSLREKLETEWEDSGWIYQIFGIASTFEEFVEYLGYDINDIDKMVYDSGAELYYQYPDETIDDFAITSGEVKVEAAGADGYKVTMNLVADSQDWIFTYEGDIEIEDHRPAPDYYTIATVYDEGDLFGNGTKVWTVEFEKSGSTDEVFLTLVGNASDTKVAAGEYIVSSSLEPMTIVPEMDGESLSYLWKMNMVWDAADEGSMTITEVSDGNYNMKGAFYDEWYEEDWKFEFKGMLTYDISDLFETPYKGSDRMGKELKPAPSRQQINARIEALKAKRNGETVKIPFRLHK